MSQQLTFGAATHVGRVRQANEDSKLHEPPLFAVADGMGGHLAGDVASQLAIEALSSGVLSDSEALVSAVRDANRQIFERASEDPLLTGMGTTITALYAADSSAQIVHVGDSRAYLFRDDDLQRLTKDHTHVGRLVEEGRLSPEDADRHPQRSYLERALGVDPEVDVDVQVLDTLPGDRLLLCSDGLYGMIDEASILAILGAEEDPQRAADRLCEAAVEAGGADNVTAIVVDYPGKRLKTSPLSKPVPTPVRRSRAKVFVWVAVVIAILGLGSLAARSSLKRSWYVGDSAGKVTIFNGIPGEVAGLKLSEAKRTYQIPVESLPAPEQANLAEGISATDRPEAERIVRNLANLATRQDPLASPSPSPGVAP